MSLSLIQLLLRVALKQRQGSLDIGEQTEAAVFGRCQRRNLQTQAVIDSGFDNACVDCLR